MINLPKIVLASASPRRAQILDAVGWPFVKHTADVDESERLGESPADYVVRLACEKAEKVAAEFPGETVLGADTTVVLDGRIIGKPVDEAEAELMLRSLSGNWHEVLTGIAVAAGGHTRVDMERTRVKFAALDASEIAYLVQEGDPLDKAGAYAVQAQAALFIEGIEGDYWNVVGLPVSLVYRLIMTQTEGVSAP